MKNLTLSLGRFAAVFMGALSLGACNRAEYTTHARATDAPLSTAVAIPSQLAPSQAASYVPVAAEASAVVKAPASLAPVVASQPSPAVEVPAAAAAAPSATAPAAATPTVKPVAKLNLVQRLALHKISKKLDKLATQAPQFKKHDAIAARGGLDANLRSAILFGLIGIILLAFSGVGGVGTAFAVIGTVLLVVGLVFLVLWLLDQA